MVIRNQLAVQDKELNGNIKANRMAPDVVLKDRKSTKIFTGLFPDQFEVLLNFLGPAVHNLKYWDSKGNDNGAGEEKGTKAGPSRWFTPREELFITLLRLRRGFSLQAIAYIFEVSASLVSKIFITWIQFIFLQFKAMQVPMFPSKDILKATLPKVFYNFRMSDVLWIVQNSFVKFPEIMLSKGMFIHHTNIIPQWKLW